MWRRPDGRSTGAIEASASPPFPPRYPERVSLRSLPALLRNEPAMTRVIGASNATLAVATPAQAFVLAGLVRLGSRRPVLVVTPTGASAEQLAHDLVGFTPGGGSGKVEVFPAWETLPFERVSPDVSTMGRRLRLLWQLSGGGEPGRPGGDGPDMVVAPIKAVLQRLGPFRTAARPVVVGKGDRVDVTSWSPSWWPWATGASPSWSTAGSWPCGAGSSTSSPPPPTSRCASTCGATRSTG